MSHALDRLIAAQAAHVAALDAGAVGAIEASTAELAAAVAGARGAVGPADAIRAGLATADGAKARVHYHADRTRRRFDRLAALAGAPRAHAYGRGGRLG